MSVTNINNYFTNATNNLKNEQKYKLSLGETLLKCDRIVLSTNSSCSPNIINDKNFSSPNNKNNNNLFNNKKQIMKEKEKGKNKEYINQPLSSNKIINTKKLKSQLLGNDYNSMGNNLTFLSNKFIESQKYKNMSKLNKKKINKKLIDIQSKNINNNGNDNYAYSEAQSNINFKKPESHRNYCHSKILSGENSNTKNKINNTNNSNKNYRITVGLKHNLKNNSQKVISLPVSPSSSGSNFYFHSNLQAHKDSSNNMDLNIKKTLEEYNKKKVVHNFNIVNNIHDNSTQINIYTGNELYKSLHFHNNSVFNSSNMTPANTYSKSPMGTGVEGGGNQIKKIAGGQQISNNGNNYFKSNIKGKEKQNKYNLNLKKILHKRILDNDKAIISERQMTRRKLFEKLGKYFFKNKNENNNTNINTNNINYNSHINNNTNSNINININNKQSNNKHNGNKHNILYNNNYTKHINQDYNRLINKIINKSKSNSSKALKHKTNNNTPNKNKINPYIIKNHRKLHNICLSPHYNDEMKKINKVSSRQINYNNIISNLNDLKNLGVDDGNKLMIHSERNKNSKIVFK